jgi:REP-associated tyrosine transposase
MQPRFRKQCKHYDAGSGPHFLTFSCYHRLPLFSRDRSRQWMLQALELGRERRQYDLWAYVVMPEHVHVVLWPRHGVVISEILTTIKQSVSKRGLLWLRIHAPAFLDRIKDVQSNGRVICRFWQRGGGYDRNLRSVDDVHEKIEYVHLNPVRRGLVDRPEEWAWSSCRAWQTGQDVPIAIDRQSVPTLTIGGLGTRVR